MADNQDDDEKVFTFTPTDYTDKLRPLVIPANLREILNLRSKKLSTGETALLPDTRPEVVTHGEIYRGMPVPRMMEAFRQAFPPVTADKQRIFIIPGPAAHGKLYRPDKP